MSRMRLTLLLSVILLTSASYTLGAEFESKMKSGFVGISEQKPLDNPFDNIFHIELDQELCGDEEVWLSYDISGLSDHYSVSRSINDQIAVGGRRVQYSSGWFNQKERINPEWLKEGDNIVRFTLPETADYGYEVRNIRLEIKKNDNNDSYLHISDPKYYQDGRVYIKGFVYGKGIIKIDGKSIETFNGQFEAIIAAKESVSVEALFENGSQFCETVTLNDAERIDNEFYYPSGVTKVDHFFKSLEKGKVSNSRAVLEIPDGALEQAQFLSINTLRSVDIPALDAGMVNVTAENAGYRFLPHGTSFAKESMVKLPYDVTKIPEGYTVNDIKTYFFDEQAHHWVPLPMDSVLTESAEVWSLTTHFTDMINGIIQVPESPEVNAYNSTSMKGIKAANPTAGINLMQPPSANNMGNANLSYPLNIPAGRNGMQPQLALSYTNAGGNGWMGLGWNMSLPSVSIDTRWGVPRYSSEKETETYSLNGQQLSPVAHRSTPENRTANKTFHPRVEGTFQRIIRRGNSPTGYWWEVTDKNGTIYTYGKDDEAVLTDVDGNRAFWTLQEVKDLNGNSVKYEYEKTEDSGTGDGNGSVKGYELYCSKITYTNHSGQEGKYSIHFLRNTDGGRRPDVTIDGRLGFKRVTADRLTKVEVKYNNKNIRHYEFKYVIGAFYKSLLSTIEEYDAAGKLFTTHELEYYDEVREGDTYSPFDTQENWNPGQGDEINTGLILSKAGFNNKYSVLSGNKSNSGGGGMTVTVGINDSKYFNKSNSLGGSFGYSESSTEGKTMLIDMNGDGLPDKLMLFGDQSYYRPNLSAVENENVFGERIQINNLGNFYKDKSKTINGGLEAHAGFSKASVFVGYTRSSTKTETSVYLTDVNGDQLPDIVKNGQILFNTIDKETGVITFSPNSEQTPNLIIASDGPDVSILMPTQEEIEAAKAQFPLHDVVRMWRAPFDGVIKIDAPVQLIETNTPNADGVKVSIQHKGNILWTTEMPPNQTSTLSPTGVSEIEVNQGDQVYFRIQSIENGEDDKVNWSPVIEYIDQEDDKVDANGKSLYRYAIEEDFVLTTPFELSVPIDGEVVINGGFFKPYTTDDVQVKITRTSESGVITTEFEETYKWDEQTEVDIDLEIAVNELDVFKFTITSNTNVNWPEIKWNPYIYYKSSFDDAIPEVIIGNDTLLQFYPAIEYSLYANTKVRAESFEVEEEIDSLTIFPTMSFGINNLSLAERLYTFSVKKRDTLLFKTDYIAPTFEGIAASDSVKIPVNKGDTLFFEYHLKSESLADRILSNEIKLILPDTSYNTSASIFTTYTKKQDFIYGPLYRNWGHFAYNGNFERADQPIIETDLKLNDSLDKEINGSDISSPEELEGQDPYNPSADNFIMLYADFKRKVWAGFDDLTFLDAKVISSSRLGEDDVSLNNPLSKGSSGFFAITKKNKSSNNSIATGAGGQFLSGSFTTSFGNTEQYTDFMDLNGDRYPDLITPYGVVFTNPTGGLTSEFNSEFHSGNFSKGDMNGVGASVNGTFKIQAKSGSTGGEQDKSDASDSKTNGSLSGNGGSGTNSSQYSWMDVNGDGLADRVNANGNVALNLGYKLGEEENWGFSVLQESYSENLGAGLGVSIGSGSESSSVGGGIGLSTSKNNLNRVLMDVNGDGLIDDVMTSNGVKVRLNKGSGFDNNFIDWTGADQANASSSTGESFNVSFTGCIPIPPPPVAVVKLCFNPSGHGGTTISRDEKRFTDINGDGFPDYIQSNSTDELKVKRSTINKTNMLKTVNRPLGASFTLDYKPEGSTYDNPNTIWTLSKVEMYDGFNGDGVDTMRTQYAYENGLYDRHEREFYGFDKVISNTLDTQNGDAVYTSVTQTFSNSTYYNKGLLLVEIMADGEGNKFIEKENTYKIKDLSGNFLADDFNSDTAAAFPALITSEQKFYEGQEDFGKSTSMEYTYNAIGNVTEYTDYGDAGPEDDLIATIKYHDYDGKYIKSAPSEIVVESTVGTLRKRQADIDQNTGNVIQIRQFLEDETVAVHDIEYNPYGNLTKMTRPTNVKGKRLSVEYEYDNIVHQFVTKVSNSYGYSSEATYDFAFGQVLESKDLNGNKITYELDDLGRVVKIVGPYEQQGAPYTIKFEYHPEATVPWALTKHYDPQNNNNDLETAIFVDGLGRVLQTKKDGAIYQGEGKIDTEMMIVSGRVLFDAFGRTTEAYYPTLEDTGSQGDFNMSFDTVDPTITTYDVLNRALTVSLPDGAITKTVYGFGSDRAGKDQFRTITTDANGVAAEQFTDVRGRVTAVKNITGDGDVWTSFDYNAINEQIAATDDLGFTTSSEYDWFGRRVKRIHPDAGTTLYSYDMAGNLTELITANLAQTGGAITYTYDFERLTDITYPNNPENNVHYTYGEAGAEYNRAGRIVIQEDATGAQEFFYGQLGEVIKNVRTVVIPKFDELTYVTEWSYDTWNRLESMIYADGEEVTYQYNAGGLLHSMEGKKKGYKFNYVNQLGYDKFEQRVYLEYGNGTKTNYTYESDRRRLKTMTAATATKRSFMDNVYEYDQVNNILGLKNNAQIPNPNQMGGSSEYSYEYDDLYRLVKAEGKYTGTGDNADHAYKLEMDYNTVGGITQKTQQHTSKGQEQKKTTYNMAYTYGEEQPHAPTHIGQQAFTYDANGNQTGWTHDLTGQRREILWDEENRIRTISDNGADHHYVYDASGTRVLKAKGTGQSIYINGKRAAGSGNMGNYTVYVNPYLVLKSGGYTKHYYIEGQRIVSKLGGGFDNNGQGPLKAGNDKINYNTKHQELFDGIVRNQKFLAPDGTILTAGKSGKIPPGQILGDNPNNAEQFQYFFHPDHLGSTSYITDAAGEVYQHLEYFAFGETFVEEHSNTHRTPYLFNGKELDEETGLYYYGARYYDAKTSIFPSVDPDAEKYAFQSPYVYAANNPIKYVDVNGEGPGDPPYKLNNVNFVHFSCPSASVITRNTGGTFTAAARAANTKTPGEYTMNMQQFETLNLRGKANYFAGSNVNMNDLQTQGLTVVNGQNQSGGRSSNSYYVSQDNLGNWSAGLGDPPSDSQIGFGGGIPLIVDGMPYGAEKKFDSNGNMIQNSSAGYPHQNNASVGKSILAFDNDGNFMMVSQQNGVDGMTLDGIRDHLIGKGYTNAISFDGSTSSTLIKDNTVINSPDSRKDNSIPVGIQVH